jgi:hypothetical protein
MPGICNLDAVRIGKIHLERQQTRLVQVPRDHLARQRSQQIVRERWKPKRSMHAATYLEYGYSSVRIDGNDLAIQVSAPQV